MSHRRVNLVGRVGGSRAGDREMGLLVGEQEARVFGCIFLKPVLSRTQSWALVLWEGRWSGLF